MGEAEMRSNAKTMLPDASHLTAEAYADPFWPR
jgi:hypothetical protein